MAAGGGWAGAYFPYISQAFDNSYVASSTGPLAEVGQIIILGPKMATPRGVLILDRLYRENELRTTRPKDKSVQDNSAHKKKSAQDNSAQVVPISAQIASTLEDLSAHEIQIRHLLMY